MPKTTVLLRIASTYRFCPIVLGLTLRPRAVSTASPKTADGRTASPSRTMAIERPTVSLVRASPRSSRLISSSNRRATRSASAGSPVMVISLPRTNTELSKAASISLSSSSRVPSRLTIEWFPGTSTLTWTCVGCCTLGSSVPPSGDASVGRPADGREGSSIATGLLPVLDRQRRQLAGGREAEHLAVEGQLGLERPADVLGAAEAVLLAGERGGAPGGGRAGWGGRGGRRHSGPRPCGQAIRPPGRNA